ncbi:FAD-dependent oxidoreductase [uncultured Dialister sp.]|jgi:thioredoxin reductase (NADPH)|uniref:FAD-dependent oxidoreductase n=1 Tax=uncultured Dialister sp. TaxID=278064 RepID=UPI002657DDB9|nr:FAD-dependent oxidoreductase [uncultured Dialister sp.]
MDTVYDAIIVGGGPAGLSAAIYMARARFHVLVIEKEKMGGQITITSEVVNYPGIFHTSGEKLTSEMIRQAKAFGAEFLSADVTGLELEGDYKTVHTSRGDFKALGIIYAGGAHPRLAGFTGETEFRGHGVAYCATCDGEFFTGRTIFVIGGGYAAVEEGLFLTKYGKKIIMVIRGDDFSIDSAAVEELKEHPQVTILYHTQVEKVEGDSAVRRVVLKDRKTGEETVYTADDGDFYGVFVFVGYAPENGLLQGKVDLNPQGYVITDRDQKTNIDGVYAAGDICVKNLRQVVTAVSDGAVAATSLEKYLGSQYRKLHMKRTYVKKVEPREEPKAEAAKAEEGAFLDDDTRGALKPVLDRFEKPITLRLYKDDSELSYEDEKLLKELASLSDKVSYEMKNAEPGLEHTISIVRNDGTEAGLYFHGVPGGHEFNSFILAMYNTAGPGQDIGEDNEKRIAAIQDKKDVTIAVSLSCTMCPDLVAAAERIAAASDKVTVHVYDLAHYPDLQNKYNIMSVPCLIVNDKDIHFGKKGVAELLDILG